MKPGDDFGPAELERVLIDSLLLTPDAEMIDRPDWAQLSTPSQPTSSRNGVFLARMSPADADARIAEVARTYAERGASFRWIVGPGSTPEDLSARLDRAGIPTVATALGMHMRVPAEIPPLREGLVVRRVGYEDIELYGEVSMRGWARGSDFGHECGQFARDALERGDDEQRSWLAYLDGEPIASTTLTLLANVGYFQGTAVVPERRRRGIYRALLDHRLAVLRAVGIEHAVIWADESTSAGVCRRTGFVPRCRAVFHELRRIEASGSAA